MIIHHAGKKIGGDLALDKASPATQGDGIGSGFTDMLAKLAGDAVDAVKSAETNAIGGLQGQVPVQKVVESLMTAERSLQTALAVRDKAVAAYQEISRMAI